MVPKMFRAKGDTQERLRMGREKKVKSLSKRRRNKRVGGDEDRPSSSHQGS